MVDKDCMGACSGLGEISGFSGPQQPQQFDFSPAMPFHDFPGDMGSAVGKCP